MVATTVFKPLLKGGGSSEKAGDITINIVGVIGVAGNATSETPAVISETEDIEMISDIEESENISETEEL